jgi:hypothetical protein
MEVFGRLGDAGMEYLNGRPEICTAGAREEDWPLRFAGYTSAD